MKVAVDVSVTPEMLAEAFAELCDDEQADFLCEVARIAGLWPPPAMESQWKLVGRRFKNRTGLPRSAVERMLRDIIEGMHAAAGERVPDDEWEPGLR